MINVYAMIKSMTGYGKSEVGLEGGKLTVEIRTLNSKSCDIGIKSPLLPKDKELLIRQKIAQSLVRGTIDVFLTWEADASGTAAAINIPLAQEYFRQISDLGESIGAVNLHLHDANYLLATLLRMPDVVNAGRKEVITEENWPLVEDAFGRCLDQVNDYREREGKALYADVTGRVKLIGEIYDEVEARAPQRIEAIRERILKAAEDLKTGADPARLEQEMIFWLEKLDINEEKVRLRQHCRYFMETIDSDPCPGKKLGFIIQEMGREINTTGSKANDAAIQQCVVRMKDELEKIREQSMNIL